MKTQIKAFQLLASIILLIGCAKNNRLEEPTYHVFDGASGKEDNSAFLINDTQIVICASNEDEILLYKTSTDGNIFWQRTLQTDLRSQRCALTITENNDIFLCGLTNINDDKSMTDILLIKLDMDGNSIWEKTYGRFSNEYEPVIISTYDGKLLLVAGSENSSSTASDLLLIKLDLAGGIDWEQTISGENAFQGPSDIIETKSDNGFLITATISQSDEDINSRINLVKVDSIGNKVWQEIGDENYKLPLSAIETSNGDLIICGESRNNGFSQVMVLKYDNQGNFIWEQEYGQVDSLIEKGYSIKQNLDNTFTILGSVFDNSGGNEDVLIFKINSDGEQSWYKSFGSTGNDRGINLFKDKNDNNIITGEYNVTYEQLDPGFNRKGNIFLTTLNGDGEFK